MKQEKWPNVLMLCGFGTAAVCLAHDMRNEMTASKQRET